MRNSRNTKQRSPTKNQEVDRHRVCPFPHNLASHWSGLSGRSRQLASSAVVRDASWPSRVPLRRDQKTQIKWKKSSDRRKVHAGVLKDLRGPHEGKKSRWQRFLCLRCEVIHDSLQFCTETFCLKKGKKKKKHKASVERVQAEPFDVFPFVKKSLRLNIFPKKQNKTKNKTNDFPARHHHLELQMTDWSLIMLLSVAAAPVVKRLLNHRRAYAGLTTNSCLTRCSSYFKTTSPHVGRKQSEEGS